MEETEGNMSCSPMLAEVEGLEEPFDFYLPCLCKTLGCEPDFERGYDLEFLFLL